jgi:hypothetical protein
MLWRYFRDMSLSVSSARICGMGLDVVVGVFGEFDEVECEEFAEDFAIVRRELATAGLPDWHEPRLGEEDVVLQDMYGFSGLHHLRRLAAHLAASGAVPPPADAHPERDAVLRSAYDRGPAAVMAVRDGSAEYRWAAEAPTAGSAGDRHTFDHLIQHSDREGYYVPIDFTPVLLSDDVLGGYLGSSQRLLEECLRVAEALDLPIDLDPESEEVREAVEGEVQAPTAWQRHGVASLTCLQLIGAAWHSIRTGAAITFC